MIIAAAIQLPNGDVFVGKRHGDCYRNAKTIMKMDHPDERVFNSKQGFINTSLKFLDREQAYHEAFICGQCEEQSPRLPHPVCRGLEVEWKPQLASEDLW